LDFYRTNPLRIKKGDMLKYIGIADTLLYIFYHPKPPNLSLGGFCIFYYTFYKGKYFREPSILTTNKVPDLSYAYKT